MQIFTREPVAGDDPVLAGGASAVGSARAGGLSAYRRLTLVLPTMLDARGQLWPAANGVGGLSRGGPASAVGWLLPHRQGGRRRGFLLALDVASICLSGLPPLPLVELRRGDELRVAGRSLFYSDEMPLEVVAFDSSTHAAGRESTNCSRCHQPVRDADPVVFCPRCGLVYMAQPDHSPNCWTFGPCLGCGRDPIPADSWHPQAASIGWRGRPGRRGERTVQHV